jgi:hypothetical protein
MKYFAEIDENNMVINIILVNDEDCLDENEKESEVVGAEFCKNLLGGVWKQTYYDANFRKNFAGIGYTYDEKLDAFIPPQLYSKWILNEETAQWESPIPPPDNENPYFWNDEKGSWENWFDQSLINNEQQG